VNGWMERMREIIFRRAEMNLDEEMLKIVHSEWNAFFRIYQIAFHRQSEI